LPSQKELKWSQLKVGILVVAAMTALTALIFLLSGSTGGLFSHKLTFRVYFANANGLKVGAPVTLDGVTIGNVTAVRILPGREPAAVEVSMKVGAQYLPSIHTDSTAAINQAGVLGDSFVDISSTTAKGPEPQDGATLTASAKPSISDVIATSQDSIQSINEVVHKVGVLIDNVNSGKGSAAMLLNDPAVAHKLVQTIDNIQTLTQKLSNGKGTLGKLLNDDELYEHANSTIAKLDKIATDLDQGKGTAGKLLKDDKLYTNLNSAIANTNTLLEGVNAGKGSLGKLAKDPAFAMKVEESLTNLNILLKGMDEGKGTLGQLVVNKALYDHLDETTQQATQLLTAFRQDPKKYLSIKVKIF
jgi:phospholipid/cholesterol/gamma-HCH transport system substrate-binding protein